MEKGFKVDTVVSKDGTTIGYRQFGRGPGLVLVNGAMGVVQHYSTLAESLADTFTVYVPERRGRGMSPRLYSKDYTIQRDVEDLEALLAKTDTSFVYGLSSGAIISLTAATQLPQIKKLAIYEPPLFSQHPFPSKELSNYNKAMERGNIARALIASMKAVQLGPALLNYIPDVLLSPMINAVMRAEDKNPTADLPTMRMMAPTVAFDLDLVSEMHSAYESWNSIRAQVLLMGGGKSPEYLKADVDTVAKILPNAKRVVFPELGHAGSWNYDKRTNPTGDPAKVATELKRFFTDSRI